MREFRALAANTPGTLVDWPWPLCREVFAIEAVNKLGLRFTNNWKSPSERFSRLRQEFGQSFEGIEIDSSLGNADGIDPTDPNVFYGEYVYLGLHRNTDGGTTSDTQGNRYITGMFWNAATNNWDWKTSPYIITDAQNQKALFIAPFVLDPNDPNRILAGGQSLWRTNDAKTPNTNTSGPSWSAIKASVGFNISAIAIANGAPDTIWVGHEDGEVYKTTNGTGASPLWQKIDSVGPQPLPTNGYCTRITIDPGNVNTVYVTSGRYQTGNVWKTTDAGATWSNIGNSLPAAPVRALKVHPRHSNFLYLGTEVGLFASEDTGATWSPTNEGPTNCSVDDLFWMGQKLVCVSHGRGLFQIDLSSV